MGFGAQSCVEGQEQVFYRLWLADMVQKVMSLKLEASCLLPLKIPWHPWQSIVASSSTMDCQIYLILVANSSCVNTICRSGVNTDTYSELIWLAISSLAPWIPCVKSSWNTVISLKHTTIFTGNVAYLWKECHCGTEYALIAPNSSMCHVFAPASSVHDGIHVEWCSLLLQTFLEQIQHWFLLCLHFWA